MIGRLFWFGLAAATGVVVYRKLSRTARSYSPSGLAGSAQQTAVGLVDSVREFMADVREGMAEREAEIHAALAENAGLGYGIVADRDTGPYPTEGTGRDDPLDVRDLSDLAQRSGPEDQQEGAPDR
jgi:hypothetical protein